MQGLSLFPDLDCLFARGGPSCISGEVSPPPPAATGGEKDAAGEDEAEPTPTARALSTKNTKKEVS